jgi:two-component system, NarL family, nitrate/nitrite response regulator NarL
VTAVAEGETNRNIAARFSITEGTVKHHLSNIFDKVGVSSRLELAMFAMHHGLVDRRRLVRDDERRLRR